MALRHHLVVLRLAENEGNCNDSQSPVEFELQNVHDVVGRQASSLSSALFQQERLRLRDAWIAAYMAGALNVSNMICVMRSR